MARIKIDVTGLTDDALENKAQHVITQLTGNPNVPTPQPDLIILQNQLDDFRAKREATVQGGPNATTLKNESRDALMQLLRDEADYVQQVSMGNQVIIESTGFETRKPPEPIGELPPPANLRASVSEFIGAVDLRWKPVYGAGTYNAYINSNDPNVEASWAFVKSSQNSTIRIEALITGTVNWFRITAIGAAGEGPPSDPARSVTP